MESNYKSIKYLVDIKRNFPRARIGVGFPHVLRIDYSFVQTADIVNASELILLYSQHRRQLGPPVHTNGVSLVVQLYADMFAKVSSWRKLHERNLRISRLLPNWLKKRVSSLQMGVSIINNTKRRFESVDHHQSAIFADRCRADMALINNFEEAEREWQFLQFLQYSMLPENREPNLASIMNLLFTMYFSESFPVEGYFAALEDKLNVRVLLDFLAFQLLRSSRMRETSGGDDVMFRLSKDNYVLIERHRRLESLLSNDGERELENEREMDFAQIPNASFAENMFFVIANTFSILKAHPKFFNAAQISPILSDRLLRLLFSLVALKQISISRVGISIRSAQLQCLLFLEKFAKCKAEIFRFLREAEVRFELDAKELESSKSPPPPKAYLDNAGGSKQIGSTELRCQMLDRQIFLLKIWLLDNLFLEEAAQFDYARCANSSRVGLVDPLQSSIQLKISADCCEVRNDSENFELAVCTHCAAANHDAPPSSPPLPQSPPPPPTSPPRRKQKANEGGRFYFEVFAVTCGVMQVGWTSRPAALIQANEARQWLGVGDDPHSFGYDVFRETIWHNMKPARGRRATRLQPGDVLGCLANLHANYVTFYVNGRRIARLRTDGDATDDATDDATRSSQMFACVSLSSGQQCWLNFGKFAFKYDAPNRRPVNCRIASQASGGGEIASQVGGPVAWPYRIKVDLRVGLSPLSAAAAASDATRQNTAMTQSPDETCQICFENRADFVILPCNHRNYCAACCATLDFCPLCRGELSKQSHRMR